MWEKKIGELIVAHLISGTNLVGDYAGESKEQGEIIMMDVLELESVTIPTPQGIVSGGAVKALNPFDQKQHISISVPSLFEYPVEPGSNLEKQYRAVTFAQAGLVPPSNGPNLKLVK